MRYFQVILLAACLLAPIQALAQFPSLQAAVTTDPTEGPAPLPVFFNGSSSTGDIIKYEWMFGDGSTAFGSTASHTFSSPGSYDVTLKVTDAQGATDQETVIVTVTEPVISIAPQAAERSVSFTWSPNPENVDGYRIYYKNGSSGPPYDGTAADEGSSPVATGNVTSFTLHGLSTTATYYFTITAYIGSVESDYAQEVVLLPEGAANSPPTAVIASSATVGSAPLQVQFDGSSSSDSDGSIVSYRWDLGDGSTATGAQVTHTYNTAGTFTAQLTVTDNDGLSASASTPVLVTQPPTGDANTPPVAAISAASNRGLAPFTVLLDAKGSTDPDGKITKYSWNYGDGSTGTGLAVKHTYPVPGNYVVTLRVTDNKGAVSPPATYPIT
ncbi:MAG: PKD domain-containing protein, partial [Desulfobulbaceae bacterium]